MADTKHLLYILPDAAYAVELVPGKEGSSYSVRDYLQVNGDFMNEEGFLAENLGKLVDKLQPYEYELILPDYLFTNTVVNIDKTGEEEVKKHVFEELIPSLDITEDNYSIQTFVLTELKGSSKVQLSALELNVLEPIRAVFNQNGGPSIKQVYSLSWTLKSLISLEPSISLVQMGASLFLAQHYIGVDQAASAVAEDAEKLVETIKTLKGAEPSIQTLYLLSSALVEDTLKEGLKGTLPLQQLADDSEESEMPSYVKQVVEAGAKTLSIPDYKVPAFTLGVASPTPVTKPEKEIMTAALAKDEPVTDVDQDQSADEAVETSLPEPTEAQPETAGAEPELKFADVPEESAAEEDKPVDLAQFSDKETVQQAAEPAPVPAAPAKKEEVMKPAPEPARPVIKNERGTNNMVRMIFIGLVSFFVTVGIGLGIGLGLLTFTQPNDGAEPTPTAEVTPTPEATPTPTPAVEIDRSEHTVRVVNATTQAGYAGEIASALEEAGFESVDAGNSLGDYEEGNYVLLDEENQDLVDLLSKDTGLELVYAEGKEVEDSAGDYTIVIVLAE